MVLKEEGDDNKQSQGLYRVYDSIAPNVGHRLVVCLLCKHAGTVMSFDLTEQDIAQMKTTIGGMKAYEDIKEALILQ